MTPADDVTPRDQPDRTGGDARDESDRAHAARDRARQEQRPDAAAGHAPWEATTADDRWRRSGVVALLWAGVLAAPAAFLLELSATFALVERACETGGTGLLWAITGAAIVVALAAGTVAWRNWRTVGADPEPRGEGVERSAARSTGHTLASELRTDAPGPIGRSRFMALAGMAVSAFFLLVVLASMVPPLVLAPCD